MNKKGRVDEYLAFLSVKYEVDPDQFFQALISAWQNRKSKCEELLITCRKKLRDRVMFLLTKGDKVVAQFPIQRNLLLKEDNPIVRARKTDSIQRYSARRADRRPDSLHIKDLRTGMKQINLKAKVLEIPKPKQVCTRFGNYAAVTNALIADETGNMKLCLWNEQINTVSEGDIIQIKNARTSMFRGEQQLRIGRNGKLNILEETEPQHRS